MEVMAVREATPSMLSNATADGIAAQGGFGDHDGDGHRRGRHRWHRPGREEPQRVRSQSTLSVGRCVCILLYSVQKAAFPIEPMYTRAFWQKLINAQKGVLAIPNAQKGVLALTSVQKGKRVPTSAYKDVLLLHFAGP